MASPPVTEGSVQQGPSNRFRWIDLVHNSLIAAVCNLGWWRGEATLFNPGPRAALESNESQ
jgi:hypothetical protein